MFLAIKPLVILNYAKTGKWSEKRQAIDVASLSIFRHDDVFFHHY